MGQDTDTNATAGKSGKSITVIIHTPGNIPGTFEVRAHDRVDKVTREAVDYFVGRNELAAGDYALAVVRDGVAVEMNDAGRLEDYDITDDDVLHLLNRAPQVDG